MEGTFSEKTVYDLNDLLRIMEILRGEGGCPWDRAQDHHSIRNNFIEETYEAVEAIDRDDPALLREELGDVLFQVVFHAQLEAEKGSFSFADVCDEICKKLINRHPHVFGSEKPVSGQESALRRWDEMKRKEKGYVSAADSLRQVSCALPSLMRAQKLIARASKHGLRFPQSDVYDDLAKRLETLKESQDDSQERRKSAWGKFLFAAALAAANEDIPAEEMLEQSCAYFIRSFSAYEQVVNDRLKGKFPEEDEIMRKLWQEVENNQ